MAAAKCQLTVRFTPQLYAEIEKRAKQQKLSMNEIVANAMQRLLFTHKEKQ